MSVPISRVRRWLVQAAEVSADRGDLLEFGVEASDDLNADNGQAEQRACVRAGVIWRGPENSVLIKSPYDLKPGDTLVLPVSASGWSELGFAPDAPLQRAVPTADEPAVAASAIHAELYYWDVAEESFRATRDKYVLRLHPSLFAEEHGCPAMRELLDRAMGPDGPPPKGELLELFRDAADELSDIAGSFKASLGHFAADTNRFFVEAYPDELGIVVTGRKRLGSSRLDLLPSLDDGMDDASRNGRQYAITLSDHTRHVVEQVDQNLRSVRGSVPQEPFRIAAQRHDWGKLDERFQAWLRGSNRTDAWLSTGWTPVILAKSAMGNSHGTSAAARQAAGVPPGFRHEVLSVQLAQHAGLPQVCAADHMLILHLIAAHHGYCRPFAPVVIDGDPPDVECEFVALTSAVRTTSQLHNLGSGIADRFWTLTRRYGWWGLAYLEAILRLADQQASFLEDAGEFEAELPPELGVANP
jgi:CRISPR-associated endonuclease/helicase Cas3